ncbi:MAG TPA: hypothetical protein VLQ48_13285 [Chloroflexia bacterium]|nr:hypothetical protein [Chloroflexia bacterium]
MSDEQILPLKDDGLKGTLTTDDSTDASSNGTYPMSREGRRQAIVLLLGVVSIAIFALWSLINILQDGVSDVEWVTGAFMLAILLVLPLVAWTLLEEVNAVVTADEDNLTYRTLGGVALQYKWPDIKGLKTKQGRGRLARFFLGNDADVHEAPASPAPNTDDDAEQSTEEPGTLLLDVAADPALQIKNPIVRFLHKQAYGDTLPLHGGLTGRSLLVKTINQHTGSNIEPLIPNPDLELRTKN